MFEYSRDKCGAGKSEPGCLNLLSDFKYALGGLQNLNSYTTWVTQDKLGILFYEAARSGH